MSGGSPTLTLVPVSVRSFKNVRRDSLTRLVMKLDMSSPQFEVLVITYMYYALLARGCGRQSKAWGGARQRGTPGVRCVCSFSLRSRRQLTWKSAHSNSIQQ